MATDPRPRDVVSIDPRTGETVEVVAQETTTAEVDRLCRRRARRGARAGGAGPRRPGRRCSAALADALEARRDDVVAVADRETGLGPTRLNGELTRTAYQLRLFAEVLEEGSYLEADDRPRRRRPHGPAARPAPHARADRPGRGVRRQQLPARLLRARRRHRLGAGRRLPGDRQGARLPPGDVAAGLRRAWRRPPARPVRRRARSASCTACRPAPTWSRTRRSGRSASPARSTAARRCWRSSSAARPDPVLRRAEQPQPGRRHAAGRRASGARRSAASWSAPSPSAPVSSAPSPGLAFVPGRPRGRRGPRRHGRGVRESAPQTLLNEGIAGSYGRISSSLADAARRRDRRARAAQPQGPGFQASPLLLATSAAELPHEVTEECFGPVAVVARYDGEKDAVRGARRRCRRPSPPRCCAGEGETELPLAVSQELRTPRRPARLRRLPDRRRGLVGPAPRRPLALDQLPAHLGGHHRHPPVPAAGHLAGRPAGGAARGAHATTTRASRAGSTGSCSCPVTERPSPADRTGQLRARAADGSRPADRHGRPAKPRATRSTVVRWDDATVDWAAVRPRRRAVLLGLRLAAGGVPGVGRVGAAAAQQRGDRSAGTPTRPTCATSSGPGFRWCPPCGTRRGTDELPDAGEWVVKPSISAGSRDTARWSDRGRGPRPRGGADPRRADGDGAALPRQRRRRRGDGDAVHRRPLLPRRPQGPAAPARRRRASGPGQPREPEPDAPDDRPAGRRRTRSSARSGRSCRTLPRRCTRGSTWCTTRPAGRSSWSWSSPSPACSSRRRPRPRRPSCARWRRNSPGERRAGRVRRPGRRDRGGLARRAHRHPRCRGTRDAVPAVVLRRDPGAALPHPRRGRHRERGVRRPRRQRGQRRCSSHCSTPGLAWWRWRLPAPQLAIGALSSSYVNSGNLGIPVSVYVLGDASYVAPVLLFQVLVMAPVGLAVLAGSRPSAPSLAAAAEPAAPHAGRHRLRPRAAGRGHRTGPAGAGPRAGRADRCARGPGGPAGLRDEPARRSPPGRRSARRSGVAGGRC